MLHLFIGSASREKGRIQRPTTTLECQSLGKVHLVDPHYAVSITRNGLDGDIIDSELPVEIYSITAKEYFQKHWRKGPTMVYDCTGGQCRYDFDTLVGVYMDWSLCTYVAIGCFGVYDLNQQIKPNLKYERLFSLDYPPRACTLPPGTERHHYMNHIKNICAYIKNRYYTDPPASWTLYNEEVPAWKVDDVMNNLRIWYTLNARTKIPIGCNSASALLDLIRNSF